MSEPKSNNALLFVGIGLVTVATGYVAYRYLAKPCPCQKHTTGEQPLIEVAEASAAMAEPLNFGQGSITIPDEALDV